MNRRIEQLNSLIQQEVADIVHKEIGQADWLITITKASVADDAESAQVWFSVLPADAGQAALDLLTKRIADIQHELNKRLVMKFVPKLSFRLDQAEEKAGRINQVLDSLIDGDPTA